MKNRPSHLSSWKTLTFMAFLIGLIYSCGGEGGSIKDLESASNYRLEIFDSLQFDLLSEDIRVADVDTETGDMLVIQPRPPKALVFDKSYNVLAEMALPEGDPKGVGKYISSGTFFNDGIVLMGQAVVNLYDKRFNFIKSLRPHYRTAQLFMPGDKYIYDFIDAQGQPQLVTYFGQPQTDLFGMVKEYYDEFNLVDVVNPKESNHSRDTVFQAIGELTADSRYKAGKAFYMIQTKFNVSDNCLYYAFNNDTTLFKRSLPQGEILDSYTIPFDEFILFEGLSMGPDGIAEQSLKRDRAGKLESVYHTGEFELVVYHSGMKLSEVESYDSDSKEFSDQLERVDFKKYLIVKNGKRVNSELKLDSKIYSVDLVDDEGIFYARQNSQVLEYEAEKYTIYKLRIVADN